VSISYGAAGQVPFVDGPVEVHDTQWAVAGETVERALVGRDRELAAVETFLDEVARRSPVLVVDGEAGIGKTILWRRSLEVARSRGCRVLSASIAEAESRYVFAGLVDLFATVADDELRNALEPPQAHALRAALLRADGPARAPGEHLVGVACLAAVRALARAMPLVLAVDDLQWLDAATARALSFVIRRLDTPGVGVLLTRRVPHGATPLDIDRLLEEAGGSRLRLPGLSLAAIARLFEARLGLTLARPALVRVSHATGGNPLYALEFARTLGDAFTGDGDPGRPLPVPAGLRQLVADRVARLSADGAAAVLATFALARPTAALVDAAAPRGLEEAVAAELLGLDAAAVSLSHPLVGSTLYAELPAAARRALHERLARLPLDEEERVRHLALAAEGPSAEVADRLEAAAERARARGAPAGAAELLELAVRLTPDQATAIRRTLALALDEFVSGSADRASERMRRLEADAPPGPLRANARWHMVQYLVARTDDERRRLLEGALADAGDEPELLARIHMTWSRASWWAGRLKEAAPHARLAVEIATACGDRAALAAGLCQLAVVEVYLGRGLRSDLLEQALALEEEIGLAFPLEALPSIYRAIIEARLGEDLDRCRAYLDHAAELALARGDEHGLAFLHVQRCEVECWGGRWEEARRHAELGRELLVRTGGWVPNGFSRYGFALLAAYEGRMEEARALAEEGLALDEQAGMATTTGRGRSVLAFIELSLGRPAEAVAWIEPFYTLLDRAGYVEPGVYRFVADYVEALVLVGRLEDGWRVVRPFERAARRLGRRYSRGAAERCRALLLAAGERLDEARRAAAGSARLLAGVGQPFEHARSLLVLGSIERRTRQRRAAAATLGEALDSFERLGAALWADRAREELSRVGLRPRAPSTLTATERRVAELAAAGHPNDRIAALAHVSVKTVEANLTRVYRKLGVRSRHQLADRLPD